MAERKLVALSKITTSWRVQLPADVKRILQKRDKKPVTVGDKVAFYVEPDGRISIEAVPK